MQAGTLKARKQRKRELSDDGEEMKKFLLFIFLLPHCVLLPIAVQAQSDTSRQVEMICGETKVRILCGYNERPNDLDNRICSHNTIVFVLPTGREVIPPVPKLHDPGSTPVSISCAVGNDSKYYIPVGYLSGSYGCNKCRVDEIYSTNGRILTDGISVPKFVWKNNLKNWNTVSIEQRSTE